MQLRYSNIAMDKAIHYSSTLEKDEISQHPCCIQFSQNLLFMHTPIPFSIPYTSEFAHSGLFRNLGLFHVL
jgi:hypothetical protein